MRLLHAAARRTERRAAASFLVTSCSRSGVAAGSCPLTGNAEFKDCFTQSLCCVTDTWASLYCARHLSSLQSTPCRGSAPQQCSCDAVATRKLQQSPFAVAGGSGGQVQLGTAATGAPVSPEQRTPQCACPIQFQLISDKQHGFPLLMTMLDCSCYTTLESLMVHEMKCIVGQTYFILIAAPHHSYGP